MKLNGARLKDLREGKELLQKQAAILIGISSVTLSNAENGDDIHLSSAQAICRFYGKEVSDLMIPRVPEPSPEEVQR